MKDIPTPRVALIGCGVISENHLAALAQCPVRVVALCDTDTSRAEEKRRTHVPDARVYTDWEQMLDEQKPDAVHICTPHYLHALMCIGALRRGIHVFLEKPMAMREEEIQSILNAEKNSTARVCVSFQNRTLPCVTEALRLAAEDGGACAGYAALIWERTKEYYRCDAWRGKWETEGGGVLINQAIHSLDLLCQFFGIPCAVSASVSNQHLRNVIEVEDTAMGRITFSDGRIANFACTTAAHGMNDTQLYIRTAHHTLRLAPPYLYKDGEPVSLPAAPGDERCIGKPVYGSGHFRLIRHFYEALMSGGGMPVSAESAQWSLRILLRAYRSEGATLPL